VDALRGRSGSYADLVAVAARFSCPPAIRFVTVYAQVLMAADSLLHRRLQPPAPAQLGRDDVAIGMASTSRSCSTGESPPAHRR
jgi:hypothetical protein